ncbi:MAG TPA: precorrin-6A reductase [Negativicutes bacterium]|nr:precorrin-6A reductase [Negativicutes bacterium]
MIILLGGTGDGREIANRLLCEGHDILITAVSEYGAALAAESGAVVEAGSLSAKSLGELVETRKAKVILDCTHPYASQISEIAQETAAQKQVMYIRYERPAAAAGQEQNLYRAADWEEAVQMSAGLGQVIFLTVGSRHLEDFLLHKGMQGKRIIARVLPEPEAVSHCRSLGLTPRDIIAMQGPFTEEMNRILFTAYGAEVIVTKDGGAAGGTPEKLAAARSLGIPVVMVNRPPANYPHVVRSYEELKLKVSTAMQENRR